MSLTRISAVSLSFSTNRLLEPFSGFHFSRLTNGFSQFASFRSLTRLIMIHGISSHHYSLSSYFKSKNLLSLSLWRVCSSSANCFGSSVMLNLNNNFFTTSAAESRLVSENENISVVSCEEMRIVQRGGAYW